MCNEIKLLLNNLLTATKRNCLTFDRLIATFHQADLESWTFFFSSVRNCTYGRSMTSSKLALLSAYLKKRHPLIKFLPNFYAPSRSRWTYATQSIRLFSISRLYCIRFVNVNEHRVFSFARRLLLLPARDTHHH